MVTTSEKCNRREACVQNGKGIIHIKDLTDKEGLNGHGRLFAHLTLDPGKTFGYHMHQNETEYFYILKGEGVLIDNGEEVVVRPGDFCVTGHNESHGVENRSNEPLELIALILSK
jgi:mannose-6-phosphate isomerase-like protein (cupin superfamily)